MRYMFTIPGKLPGLNEYIDAERRHRLKAAQMKARYEKLIQLCIRNDLGLLLITKPVFIDYHFYEPNRRRDKSNISGYARKMIEDALVKCRVLENDGWRNIAGYQDRFDVDKNRPRIEITIMTEDEK